MVEVRRSWLLVAAVAGAGGMAAVATWYADQRAMSAGLAVTSAVLTTVAGAVAVQSKDSPSSSPDLVPAPPLELDRQLPVVFRAIPRPAKWFQPRPVEQEALALALGDESSAALVALPGARGAGKTQLAAACARGFMADGFDLVAWINAEAGPVAELVTFGHMLGLDSGPETPPEQIAAAVIKTMSVHDGRRRLLVYDNVTDPDSITDWLPASGTAKVIITSIRKEFTTMDGITAISVGMFTPAQGRALLTQATGLPDCAALVELGEQLGWLPLGLAQAAAYIRLNDLSYRQYLSRLSQVNVDDALQRYAGAQHRGVLAATRLTLDALDRGDPAGKTRRLPTVLSMLAADGIKRVMLLQPTGLADALGMDEAESQRALGLLVNTSLVTYAHPDTPGKAMDQAGTAGVSGRDRTVVVVHRLTAKIVRHQAALPSSGTFDSAADIAVAALRSLTAKLDPPQAAHRRADVEHLVGHVMALQSHTRRYLSDLDRRASWAAEVLTEIGDYPRAITMRQTVLDTAERALGPDHPHTLAARHNLANSYWSAGRYHEAIGLHERTLADRQRTLGSDHPDTRSSRDLLANCYRSAGRHDDASHVTQNQPTDA